MHLVRLHLDTEGTMTKFITVTTKDVSQFTGKPKLYAINIAHIVSVEPTIFELQQSGLQFMDTPPAVIEGCNIVINVNAAHIIEVATRDPFEHVLKRIQLADGVIQIGDTQAEVDALTPTRGPLQKEINTDDYGWTPNA